MSAQTKYEVERTKRALGIVGARPAGDIGAKKEGKTKANRIASKRRDSDKRCNPELNIRGALTGA